MLWASDIHKEASVMEKWNCWLSVWYPPYTAVCWDLRGGMPPNPQPTGSQLFHECWLLCEGPAHHLVRDLKFQISVAASRCFPYFSGVHLHAIHSFLPQFILLDFYLEPMNTVVCHNLWNMWLLQSMKIRSVLIEKRHRYLFQCKKCWLSYV